MKINYYNSKLSNEIKKLINKKYVSKNKKEKDRTKIE